MAASGLTPETNYKDLRHVVALTEYAFAIKDQLKSVNEHSFNNFKMRVGKFKLFCFFHPTVFLFKLSKTSTQRTTKLQTFKF